MRLVLADNDSDALDLIDLDLRLEGHDIVGLARDGESAVALCEAVRPDVLVVDFRMPPGIDGVEVARRVVEAGTAGRVILYSNYRAEEALERARSVGATWVPKGHLSDLRAALR